MFGFYVHCLNSSSCILLLKKVKLIRSVFEKKHWGKNQQEYLIKCITEYYFHLNNTVTLAIKSRIQVS